MNVYIVETAKRLAGRGVEVEIFTRATSSEQPPLVALCPGVHVRHVTAGPFEGLAKGDLPAQLCAFTAGVMRAEVHHDPGWYDVIHSHYWLSGQVGWLARERWGVPLVHSAHTLARVKNALLAEGDDPEPLARVIGEEQVVAEADQLIASTADEARDLVRLYGGRPDHRAGRRPGRVPARVGAGRPHPAGAADRCADPVVRRPHPTVEGAGRAAARRGPGPR
jgi:D-inositol-3-phosphate glycosyltransferase